MKFSWNVLLQILGVVFQAVNGLGKLVPPKAQAVMAVGVGTAQGVIGAIAHFYTPNGTPVSSLAAPGTTGPGPTSVSSR